MAENKVHENLLRRMAGRQGLTLHRSRRRDPRALDYGRYWLKDTAGTAVTAATGTSIEEVEAFLLEGTPARSTQHLTAILNGQPGEEAHDRAFWGEHYGQPGEPGDPAGKELSDENR